jgi:riboflavin synthase
MFTGIVEDLGTVVALEPLAAAGRLTVRSAMLAGTSTGDSVAVNGVCLTAVEVSGTDVVADVMNETLDRSTLGALAPGDRVNLELAVTPSTRLGGHIVQGHVDGVGTVRGRRSSEHWDEVDVELPDDLARYVVEKGSVTLDGVSLTVTGVVGDVVGVSLIPETLRRTTLGARGVGERVNVEVDVLAKYVERLLAKDGERLLAKDGERLLAKDGERLLAKDGERLLAKDGERLPTGDDHGRVER